MNRLNTLSATALFLLLGLAVPAIALQEKPEENAKPPKQEQPAKPEKQEQAKPEKQAPAKSQQQTKAPKQEEQAKPVKQAQATPEKQEQAKPAKQAQAKTQTQPKQQQPKAQQQAKAQPQTKQQPKLQTASSHGAPQRSQQAMATQRSQPALHLSARGSARIPEDRFRASFGSGHNFHMGNPVIVGGFSRFQQGGFWFGFVDPWPVGWYYTDDFYIDYVDGGYYMYNPYYPGARFALTVVIWDSGPSRLCSASSSRRENRPITSNRAGAGNSIATACSRS